MIARVTRHRSQIPQLNKVFQERTNHRDGPTRGQGVEVPLVDGAKAKSRCAGWGEMLPGVTGMFFVHVIQEPCCRGSKEACQGLFFLNKFVCLEWKQSFLYSQSAPSPRAPPAELAAKQTAAGNTSQRTFDAINVFPRWRLDLLSLMEISFEFKMSAAS